MDACVQAVGASEVHNVGYVSVDGAPQWCYCHADCKGCMKDSEREFTILGKTLPAGGGTYGPADDIPVGIPCEE